MVFEPIIRKVDITNIGGYMSTGIPNDFSGLEKLMKQQVPQADVTDVRDYYLASKDKAYVAQLNGQIVGGVFVVGPFRRFFIDKEYKDSRIRLLLKEEIMKIKYYEL